MLGGRYYPMGVFTRVYPIQDASVFLMVWQVMKRLIKLSRFSFQVYRTPFPILFSPMKQAYL